MELKKTQMLHRKIKSLAARLTGSDKLAFSLLCKHYHLVYFGKLNHNHDEDIIVRGVLMTTCTDQNLMPAQFTGGDDKLKLLEHDYISATRTSVVSLTITQSSKR
jgi:hypothetical protein